MLVASTIRIVETPRSRTGRRARRAGTRSILRALARRFLPHHIVLLIDSDATRRILPRVSRRAGMRAIDGQPTAYVCENYACQLPDQPSWRSSTSCYNESKSNKEDTWKDLEQPR